MSRPAVARPLLLFWMSFVALYTVRAALLAMPHPGGAFVRRVGVALCGIALSWAIARLLRMRQLATPLRRLVIALSASLPAGVMFATCNYLVFDIFLPLPGEDCGAGGICDLRAAFTAVSDLCIAWTFVFAAWGFLFISLLSSGDVRAAESATYAARIEAGEARDAARIAEVRALRYQVNPHFLYNVLNSISALVRRRSPVEAERLIAEVGRFFRRTLSADIVSEHSLEDEVDLQLQYLAIEQHRFPERLKTDVQLAQATKLTLVPVMILQPIVENSIKHGVGESSLPVTIRISSSALPDEGVLIEIDDNAKHRGEAPASPGLGIGLRNVGERLRARYGLNATLSARAVDLQGFRTTIALPPQPGSP